MGNLLMNRIRFLPANRNSNPTPGLWDSRPSKKTKSTRDRLLCFRRDGDLDHRLIAYPVIAIESLETLVDTGER